MRVPKELLRDRVTIENFAGSGAMGPTFGAPRVVRASVQVTDRYVQDEKENIATSGTYLIIRPEDGPVPLESRVTLPSGSKHRVLRSFPTPDARRPTHFEVFLGRWTGA